MRTWLVRKLAPDLVAYVWLKWTEGDKPAGELLEAWNIDPHRFPR
jgi:hypothetical protein